MTGRSFIVAAACAPSARVLARQRARIERHPSPDASILYVDDLGPAAGGGRRFEVVIQDTTEGRPR